MNDIEEQELKNSIALKLNPGRFPNVSGKMFACLGAFLNQHWSNPRIASIVVTSDGFLMGRDSGDIGFNEFIGTYDSFQSNLWGMVDSAGDVSDEEKAFLVILLTRLENGEETTSGDVPSMLSLDALNRQN